MINPAELTLGNRIWVTTDYRTDTEMKEYIVTTKFFCELEAKRGPYLLNYYPIPLTDEILVEMGFTKKERSKSFVITEGYRNPLKLWKHNGHYYVRVPGVRSKAIESVHHLENLLFFFKADFYVLPKEYYKNTYKI